MKIAFKFIFRRSIKAKFTGMIVGIVLCIICLLVFILARNATTLLLQESKRQLSQNIEQSAQILTSFMEVREANLDMWASNPLIKTFLGGNEELATYQLRTLIDDRMLRIEPVLDNDINLDDYETALDVCPEIWKSLFYSNINKISMFLDQLEPV